MSLWKRGGRYWTDFTVDGARYRKPLRTANRNVAKERERDLVQAARRGRLSDRESGPRDLSGAVAAYLDAKRMRCSARTIELEEERLSIVKKHFGDIRLTAITRNGSPSSNARVTTGGSRTGPSTWTSAFYRACSSPADVGVP
jgi:hypothetical protein